MPVVTAPFLSFEARGQIGKTLVSRRVLGKNVISSFPRYNYRCSADQLVMRDEMRRHAEIIKLMRKYNKLSVPSSMSPSVVIDNVSGHVVNIRMACGLPGEVVAALTLAFAVFAILPTPVTPGLWDIFEKYVLTGKIG